jgi:hypothetical protein
MPKLMVAHPFLLFKNWPFQSYGLYSSISIDLKSGSPDPADFAKPRCLLPRLWHIAQRRLRYAKVAQTMVRTANIHHLVFLHELPHVCDPFVAALAVRTMFV